MFSRFFSAEQLPCLCICLLRLPSVGQDPLTYFGTPGHRNILLSAKISCAKCFVVFTLYFVIVYCFLFFSTSVNRQFTVIDSPYLIFNIVILRRPYHYVHSRYNFHIVFSIGCIQYPKYVLDPFDIHCKKIITGTYVFIINMDRNNCIRSTRVLRVLNTC